MIASTEDLLYLRIARTMEQQINREVLRIGDRLPSLRNLCREYGVSQSTALQAYYYLEGKGLIESRPQSGYFVCHSPRRFPAIPQVSSPGSSVNGTSSDAVIARVYNDIGDTRQIMLSLGVPATGLLPVPKLNKALLQATRDLEGSGTQYSGLQGNEKLRRGVARRALVMKGNLSEADLVTTAGCMNALAFSMMALAQKGDTIAVESPVYFGVLQLARSLGLKVLELPTHPQSGIEVEALEKVMKSGKIRLCLLVSNFSNPIGSCMPDDHKRAVVALVEKYGIPLIEDDLYADVYFGQHRPSSCKSYDESGSVIWCGSVSKTLAPGYRVGWVAPGRFREKILQLKLCHSVASPTITEAAIGIFLESGRYESHLRKLRQVLHTNSLQYIRAIRDYFPEGTMISRPEGGFFLWVELDRKIDTVELYERAIRQRISIAPGRMFTLQDQYHHCMRLSYGLPWNEKLDAALKSLGKMAKLLLQGK